MSTVNRREFLEATGAGVATMALPACGTGQEPPAIEESEAEDDVPIGRKRFCCSLKLMDGRIVTMEAWQYGILLTGGSLYGVRHGQGLKGRSLFDVFDRHFPKSLDNRRNSSFLGNGPIVEVKDIEPKLTIPLVRYSDAPRGSLASERKNGLSELHIDDLCAVKRCDAHRGDINRWPLLVTIKVHMVVKSTHETRLWEVLKTANSSHQVIAWVSRETQRWCIDAVVRQEIDSLFRVGPEMPHGTCLTYDSDIADFIRLS